MSEPQLAGRGRRLAATAVDAALVPTLSVVLVMIAGVVEDAEDYADNGWMLWVLLLAIASYLLLNGWWLWRRGQTVGKRLLGIAVVNATGDRNQPAPLWKLVCLRAPCFALLFLVALPPITLVPVIDQLFIFGRQRRCLHDWLAGTIVVRYQPR